MNSFLRRRRAMMAQKSGSEWTDIIPSQWAIGKYIDGNGNVKTGNYGSLSSYINVSPGSIVRRTGSQTDGNGINIGMYVHEFTTSSNWIKRTAITVGGEDLTLGSTTGRIRLSFSYASSTGLTMTQEIIDNYYGAQIKEGS